ncbi:MAG: glycerophosphodiester phosphodiesterase [Actinobacteria bacterium]|nr:glycerophosphodiester phosphodiesterase [Actinomycetota bacterium]
MLTNPTRPYPAVLGHRGARAYAIDNSADAFRLAHEQGADGVELDVRRTGDDHIVVHHDPDIAGLGPIIDATLEDIRAAAPSVLLLDEALALLPGIINVEIKNDPEQPDHDERHEMASWIVSWIDRYWLHDRVFVSSFNHQTVLRVTELDRRVTTGQLLGPATDPANHLDTLKDAHIDMAIPHLTGLQLAGPGIGSDAAQFGISIVAWGVDTHQAFELCAASGIAGIITDDPADAIAFYASE